MRRPIDVRLTPADQAAYWAWSRRSLGLCLVIIASVIAFPQLQRAVSGDAYAHAGERSRDQSCAGWDEAASDAIVQLVQGKRDIDLRSVGDATFRMRRARRNCDMGWQRLACLDYHAIIRGSPGIRNTLSPAQARALCSSGRETEALALYDSTLRASGPMHASR